MYFAEEKVIEVMHVLPFITADPNLQAELLSFLKTYEKLALLSEDAETFFFAAPGSTRNEIYFYKDYDDPQAEFRYNYTEEEQERINTFFGERQFHMFGLQYRTKELIRLLLIEFKAYLHQDPKCQANAVLLFHPGGEVESF